jgi:prophage maintenance system killer protein
VSQNDIAALLAEIDALLREGIDLSSSEPEFTVRIVKLLSAAARYLNLWLLDRYGGHEGEDRGSDLLEQVVAAPFQTWGGVELHPDPFEKAAMLWRGITQGHPFGDGNKRAGFALATYYLHLLGLEPAVEDWDEEEVYGFNIKVSSGEVRDITEMRKQLLDWWGLEDIDTSGTG